MTTKKFEIEINAKPEYVWFAMWDNYHYSSWTGAFCEGSYAITDWQQGSKYHFLSPSGDGIFGIITESIPNQKMYFTHTGAMKNFEEQPPTEETKAWNGAKENYTLSHANGITTVSVELDLEEKYLDYFTEVYPKALQKLKQNAENFRITVETRVNASLQEIWEKWANPEHIVGWNHASDEWHTTQAHNELKTGGNFNWRMEAKDGSMGFDFKGNYTNVVPQRLIEYDLGDNRTVRIEFLEQENRTYVKESFVPENINSLELQRNGWQAILDNFKNYVERK